MEQNVMAFAGQALEILFFVLLLIFTIQSVILAYHWFTFGDSRKMSLTALAVYLTGGAVLFLTFSVAMNIT